MPKSRLNIQREFLSQFWSQDTDEFAYFSNVHFVCYRTTVLLYFSVITASKVLPFFLSDMMTPLVTALSAMAEANAGINAGTRLSECTQIRLHHFAIDYSFRGSLRGLICLPRSSFLLLLSALTVHTLSDFLCRLNDACRGSKHPFLSPWVAQFDLCVVSFFPES